MANQPKTYTAPHDVYVDRQYHRAGRPFSTAAAKGKDWEVVGPVERAAADAADPIPGDVPLESLSLDGLKAVAIEKRVNPTGLSRAKLIDAIKAANEPAL